MDLDHLLKLVKAALDEETDGAAYDDLVAYIESTRAPSSLTTPPTKRTVSVVALVNAATALLHALGDRQPLNLYERDAREELRCALEGVELAQGVPT